MNIPEKTVEKDSTPPLVVESMDSLLEQFTDRLIRPGVYLACADVHPDLIRRSQWSLSGPLLDWSESKAHVLQTRYNLEQLDTLVQSAVSVQGKCLIIYRVLNLTDTVDIKKVTIESQSSSGIEPGDRVCSRFGQQSQFYQWEGALVVDTTGASSSNSNPDTSGLSLSDDLVDPEEDVKGEQGEQGKQEKQGKQKPNSTICNPQILASIAGKQQWSECPALFQCYPHFEFLVRHDARRWSFIRRRALEALAHTDEKSGTKDTTVLSMATTVASRCIRSPFPKDLLIDVREWLVRNKELSMTRATELARRYLVAKPKTTMNSVNQSNNTTDKPIRRSARLAHQVPAAVPPPIITEASSTNSPTPPDSVVNSHAKQLIQFTKEIVDMARREQYPFVFLQLGASGGSKATHGGGGGGEWMIFETGMFRCLYTHRCSQCTRPGCLLHCQRCGFVYYCSRACQEVHWLNEHQQSCKVIMPQIFDMAANLLLLDHPPLTIEPHNYKPPSKQNTLTEIKKDGNIKGSNKKGDNEKDEKQTEKGADLLVWNATSTNDHVSSPHASVLFWTSPAVANLYVQHDQWNAQWYHSLDEFAKRVENMKQWKSIQVLVQKLLSVIPVPYQLPLSENVALDVSGTFRGRTFGIYLPIASSSRKDADLFWSLPCSLDPTLPVTALDKDWFRDLQSSMDRLLSTDHPSSSSFVAPLPPAFLQRYLSS